jgi:hypothetical protein
MSTDDATPTPTPAGTSTGLDRRSALKKAAVAGAVAWTAPTILSSEAHAVELIGACTAKCAPNPTIAVGGTSFLFCNTNGAKWVRLTFSVSGIVCPCEVGGAAASFLGGDVSPNPAEVKSVTYDAGTNTGSIIIGGSGNGALGNGSYEAALNFCVQCNDRSNPPDVISRRCTTLIDFTFQPADGPCSDAANVGTASLQGTVCQAPECAICPAPA